MFYSGTKLFVFRAAAPKVPPLLHDSQMKMMMRVLVFGLLSDECFFSDLKRSLSSTDRLALGLLPHFVVPLKKQRGPAGQSFVWGHKRQQEPRWAVNLTPKDSAVKDTPRGTQVELHRQETNKEPAGDFCSLSQLITQLWDRREEDRQSSRKEHFLSWNKSPSMFEIILTFY